MKAIMFTVLPVTVAAMVLTATAPAVEVLQPGCVRVAALTVVPSSSGSLDFTFDPTAGGTLPGIECDSYPPSINALVLQPDGKAVIGGWIDRINGAVRRGLARLNPDGTLDSSFQFACSNEFVVAVLLQQPDQRILVLGRRAFSGEPLPPYSGLIRLNADGSFDSSFTNYWEDSWMPSLACLALQADGKILVGGEFMEPRSGLARFNADGTLDETFHPPNLPTYDGDSVNAIVVQPDGKILVVGTDVIGFFRLNPDGSRDDTFNLAAEVVASPEAILLQPDGRILIGLAGCCGQCASLARLHPDGSMDESFARANLGTVPWRLALQPDGRILLAGYPLEWGHDSAICRLNPDGSIDTRFQATVNAWHGWPAVAAIVLQSDGQILVGGGFSGVNGFPVEAIARLINAIHDEPPSLYGGPSSITRFAGQIGTFTASVAGTPPLSYQWWYNGRVIPGATNTTLTLDNVQPVHAGHYVVTVANAFGSVTSPEATLTVLPLPAGPGSVDITFDPTASGRRVGVAGQGASVNAIAVEPDGAVLIGGDFIGINGKRRNGVARLHADGSLDPSLDGLGVGGVVYALVRQADGKVLVVGRFSAADGQPHSVIVRFNPDGSLDPGFNATITGAPWAWANSLALQADDKIVVGGRFTKVNGIAITNLARLNADGTLDQSFDSAYSWGGDASWIFSIALQPDGKILVGGHFRAPHPGVARLNPDGSLDAAFVPQIEADSPYVQCVALQSDGKIIVGGQFFEPGHHSVRVTRLNSDGSLDADFDAGEVFRFGGVRTAVVQADGRILLGGACNTAPCGPVRLNIDGSIDPSFNPGAAEFSVGPCINAVVLDASSRILCWFPVKAPWWRTNLGACGGRRLTGEQGMAGKQTVHGERPGY